ncbi:YciI family protein [Psychromicrobium sp. YIM B11713]|uniref:YciI family protein n=1 Tax=Psychromicrobium sp. YIM B11713 TaxID=3145233 RepID=UPI00374ED0EE
MQSLVSVINDTLNPVIDDRGAEIDVFNEKLQAKGYWVFAGGLSNPDAATTIDNRDGNSLVTDGPFAETKEFVNGFWIMEVPDFDTVLQLAIEASQACQRKTEVRPFL